MRNIRVFDLPCRVQSRQATDNQGSTIHPLIYDGPIFTYFVICDESRPGVPITGHDIQHARRKPGLLGQLRDVQRRQRRLLRRFEHDGVPHGQCGPDLPRHHQQREVPRDDLPAHAHGLVSGVAEEVPVQRYRLPVVLVSPAGGVPQDLDGAGHIDWVRVAVVRLSVVGGFQTLSWKTILVPVLMSFALTARYAASRSMRSESL